MIGCSIAYHLAGAGVKVTLVERGEIGGGASSVAAGMIAALSEGLPQGDPLKAALESRAMLLNMLPQLQSESGIDVEYVTPGILHISLTPEDDEDLNARLKWQVPLKMGVRWLSTRETHNMEPALREDIRGAIFSPQEGQLNSRRLVKALAIGAARRGTTILENSEVIGLLTRDGQVTGVKLPSTDLDGEWVILAPGAWAGQYGNWLDVSLPVHPVRGQIMAVRTLPSPISRTVWHDMTYLVPKADGSVVIGTTRENAGFRSKASIQGIATILTNAIGLVPAIGDAELHKVWAGLRPGTPDGSPILGPIQGWDGVLMAIGHYRSGILMSTITGKLITDYITRGNANALRPFALSRFT